MASSISFKMEASFSESYSAPEEKRSKVRNAIPGPSSASYGRRKWEKKANDEDMENAVTGVLGGKKAPPIQFADTKKLRAEFERRAKEDPDLEAQRKNILGTLETLEDAQNILTGSKVKYKHFGSHKRGDRQLQRVCVELHEGVRQAYERAEALEFSSYFFSKVLPKNGCYEKTTAKITDHNSAFLAGGTLFLQEMANIYQVSAKAKRPMPLEAFQEFLAPFAQKFPYDKGDFQLLMAEGILSAEADGRPQEILAIMNSLFDSWVAEDGGENMMKLDPFKAYLRANAETRLSAEEMERFDTYVEAFFRQNSNAERMLILKSTDWF